MGNTVFISWSGERSQYVAQALRDWLPAVLQIIKPWVSAADVEKGSRWESEISATLDEANVGIICLTPENLNTPWLLFEAGALSKKLGKSRVCTYLLDLTPAQVPPPMGMFQHTVIARDDTRKLLGSINNVQSHPIGKEILDKSFGALWPELEEKFKNIPRAQETTKVRELKDMVEELLAMTRGLPHLLNAEIGLLELRTLIGQIRAATAAQSAIAPATEVPPSGSTEAHPRGGILPEQTPVPGLPADHGSRFVSAPQNREYTDK